MAADAAAHTGNTAAHNLGNLPMEGDMVRELSHLNTSELFGKLFGFGISLYAIALLAQVLQSYSLV